MGTFILGCMMGFLVLYPMHSSLHAMYWPHHQQPAQLKNFAQTQREANEEFYATFPDARRAAEAQHYSALSTYCLPGIDYYYSAHLDAPIDLECSDSGYITLGGGHRQPTYIATHLNSDNPPPEVTHPASTKNIAPQQPFSKQQQQQPHHQLHTCSVCLARHLVTLQG